MQKNSDMQPVWFINTDRVLRDQSHASLKQKCRIQKNVVTMFSLLNSIHTRIQNATKSSQIQIHGQGNIPDRSSRKSAIQSLGLESHQQKHTSFLAAVAALGAGGARRWQRTAVTGPGGGRARRWPREAVAAHRAQLCGVGRWQRLCGCGWCLEFGVEREMVWFVLGLTRRLSPWIVFSDQPASTPAQTTILHRPIRFNPKLISTHLNCHTLKFFSQF